MPTRILSALLAAAMLSAATANTAHAGSSLGGGVHYLRNLGDIKDNGYDENSFSILGSYQLSGPLLAFEADLEYIFDYAGTDEAMWEPSAWLLAGGFIYGGVGIGIGYIDGDWQDEPFYALRGGVALPLGSLGLDLFATYRFQNDEAFEDLTGDDLDSVTFGAVLRMDL
ncbi:MAG TPA: hypothetical protein VFT13_13690 [Candidatus Krumholzibacteria bacterium]|nr:hypothetical protein [Candidatus Krumholzibacteria bacterium]